MCYKPRIICLYNPTSSKVLLIWKPKKKPQNCTEKIQFESRPQKAPFSQWSGSSYQIRRRQICWWSVMSCDEQEHLQTQQDQQHTSVHGWRVWHTQGFIYSLPAISLMIWNGLFNHKSSFTVYVTDICFLPLQSLPLHFLIISVKYGSSLTQNQMSWINIRPLT